MSLMLMPGFAQPSRLPWSRWTNRKRPAFSSLTTWSRPSVQGVAGRFSSSGIGVLSLKSWMSAVAWAVFSRVTTWPRERQPGAHLLGRQREAAPVAWSEPVEVRGDGRVVVEVVARRRRQLGLVAGRSCRPSLGERERVRGDAARASRRRTRRCSIPSSEYERSLGHRGSCRIGRTRLSRKLGTCEVSPMHQHIGGAGRRLSLFSSPRMNDAHVGRRGAGRHLVDADPNPCGLLRRGQGVGRRAEGR